MSADNIVAAGFPEQSVSVPEITGSWAHDTLKIRAAGLAWITVPSTVDHPNGFFVRLNESTAAKPVTLNTDKSIIFTALLHDGFPTTGCRAYYRIITQE